VKTSRTANLNFSAWRTITFYAAQELGLIEVIPDADIVAIQSALQATSENDSSQRLRDTAMQSYNSNQRYLETKESSSLSITQCG